ncbi:Carboxylesterase NlhH [Planctomycetales bacterium 10988]|nr:Carboxylesterase NlhH [Planctomycetales bacterium 10988]
MLRKKLLTQTSTLFIFGFLCLYIVNQVDAQTFRERLRQRFASQQEQAQDVEIIKDIAYREGSSAWKLDLMLPKKASESPRPAIIFIHGGGWRNGDKGRGYFYTGAIDYAKDGYVTMTINYRLLGEAPFPSCIEDVKCAVRWLRAYAEKYNVDPDRIGAYGNSAGAHLVSMLGLAGQDAKLEGDGPWQEHSSAVQAVCASATPADFLNWGRQGARFRNFSTMFGESSDTPEELARRSSPMTYVSAEAPPFLLVHGTADGVVPYSQGRQLEKALKKAGAKDVTLLTYEQAGHGVFNQHAKETHPKMKEFFNRVLREQ